jgi:thioredoxin-dependent peroxiredoxin
MIEQGDAAPDFGLPDQDGRAVKLSDFRGQPVVVYFYPKADTPGCTVQACGVRDHRADYQRVGSVVLGISPDPAAKVKAFHEKYDLDFPLLADEDHAVADSYGVWAEKSMYGKTYFGNERTTFIVDADGKVAQVLRKVKPAEHDELVLQALKDAGLAGVIDISAHCLSKVRKTAYTRAHQGGQWSRGWAAQTGPYVCCASGDRPAAQNAQLSGGMGTQPALPGQPKGSTGCH